MGLRLADRFEKLKKIVGTAECFRGGTEAFVIGLFFRIAEIVEVAHQTSFLFDLHKIGAKPRSLRLKLHPSGEMSESS
jgi:hypothetical protein